MATCDGVASTVTFCAAAKLVTITTLANTAHTELTHCLTLDAIKIPPKRKPVVLAETFQYGEF